MPHQFRCQRPPERGGGRIRRRASPIPCLSRDAQGEPLAGDGLEPSWRFDLTDAQEPPGVEECGAQLRVCSPGNTALIAGRLMARAHHSPVHARKSPAIPRRKSVDSALLGGRPLPLPLCRRPLFLCGETPSVRAPGRFGRTAAGRFGSEALCHEVGELGQCDLTVAQLGAPLRGGHRDHPGDETSSEARDQQQPLALRKRRRAADVPREFNAAVRGVDVLTAGPGRTREPPAEFRRGNRERGRHLQIHTSSVAHYGREQIP